MYDDPAHFEFDPNHLWASRLKTWREISTHRHRPGKRPALTSSRTVSGPALNVCYYSICIYLRSYYDVISLWRHTGLLVRSTRCPGRPCFPFWRDILHTWWVGNHKSCVNISGGTPVQSGKYVLAEWPIIWMGPGSDPCGLSGQNSSAKYVYFT